MSVRALLDAGDLADLFIGELGWDNPPDRRDVSILVEGHDAQLIARPLAAKRGVTLFQVAGPLSSEDLRLVDRAVGRRSIQRLVVASTPELQVWLWPEPRPAGGVRYIRYEYLPGSANEAFVQRLESVRFTLEEESGLGTLEAWGRIRASFNSDAVTAAFFRQFKDTHEVLTKAIEGISDSEKCSWYSSILMNRLMFIYFLQKKGFLNDDHNYLRTSLAAVRQRNGPDHFYEFYRDFLMPLFHSGLGAEALSVDDPIIAGIIGDVPYVNGGIFAPHPIEVTHDIRVADEEFGMIFDFFDQYRWHLDERPTGNPQEINPEVLGHIFEQYVNQKEEGAYYTREDVTGYMVAGSLLPLFLERLEERAGVGVTSLLASDPIRYIPEGLSFGNDSLVAGEKPLTTPESVSPPQMEPGLPGESAIEIADRRTRSQALIEKLAGGERRAPEELFASGVDLLALSVDLIGDLQSPFEVSAAFKILHQMRVLDPTVGSGAFLFAALKILEELYQAIVTRARELVEKEADGTEELQTLLSEVNAHPSPEYFIIKSILLRNLYGLDLMEEAIEIARLRLFLALVSRLQERSELEPLPDLDLNLRAGNLLVGLLGPESGVDLFSGNLLASGALPGILERAGELRELVRSFTTQQEAGAGSAAIAEIKDAVVSESAILREQLDRFYWEATSTGQDLEGWRKVHQPFHWFIEFPEVMLVGGFDAVVGNPPYVKATTVPYSFPGLRCSGSRDIFAPCMERAAEIVRPDGRYALIVPISFQMSEDFADAREAVANLLPRRWVSTYSRNPSALFYAGLGVRSSIVIGSRGGDRYTATTSLRRWQEAFRSYLFQTNRYAHLEHTDVARPWPRLGHPDVALLYQGLTSRGWSIGSSVARNGPRLGFKQTALYYVSVFVDEPPAWEKNGTRAPQTKVGWFSFPDEVTRDLAFITLAGRLSSWWWAATGDDFDVTKGLLLSFPVNLGSLRAVQPQLLDLASQLRLAQPATPIVTLYAGREMGNYDMSRLRSITDQSDQLILEVLGLGDLWPAVLLADAWLVKVTGERPGTERDWPFPWKAAPAEG